MLYLYNDLPVKEAWTNEKIQGGVIYISVRRDFCHLHVHDKKNRHYRWQ
jgi:hypothetical protein